jgi:tripartite-type tricarboxylate transporter receptor subunit TctC
MAPAGTPAPIIQKVSTDLRKVIAIPDVIERLQTLGTYTRDLSPAQTEEFLRSEEQLWWPIVRRINQKGCTRSAKRARAARMGTLRLDRPR